MADKSDLRGPVSSLLPRRGTSLDEKERHGSQIQRDMDLRAWLESINPRYGKFAPAFEDHGVDLEEIDDGLPEDILSSVQSALSDHGAKKTQLSKIMSQLRTRIGSTRGDQTGLSSPSPSPFSPFASAAAGTPASAVELPEDLMLDPSRIAIARDIGNGASATVHDATYELVNGREQAVVFKRFKPEMLEDPKDLNDIKNEVATMHKVDMSPFVLSLLGVNTDPRAIDKNGAKLGVGLMLEKASEGSAYEFLRTDPPPAWDVRMGLLLDSARGMLALHGHKTPLIHRDLKSLNILVCKVLQAGGKHQFIGKVADFGLARKITPITQKSAPLQTSLLPSALSYAYISVSHYVSLLSNRHLLQDHRGSHENERRRILPVDVARGVRWQVYSGDGCVGVRHDDLRVHDSKAAV